MKKTRLILLLVLLTGLGFPSLGQRHLKRPVGERLARWALAQTYYHNLTLSGHLTPDNLLPEPIWSTPSNCPLRLSEHLSNKFSIFMKSFFLTLLCSCALTLQPIQAQTAGVQVQRTYSTYYYQRASHFAALPTSTKDIIFLGNSITDGAEWSELFGNRHIKNRGISGDTTWGVYDRLDTILQGKPKKIFLLIGINDIGRGQSDDYVIQGIERIVQRIRTESPRTRLYVQSLLPVNPVYGKFSGHTSQWERIPGLNRRIRQLADQAGVEFVDLYTAFADEKGQMKADYTNDGLHLLGPGYNAWKKVLGPYLKK